MKNFKRLISLTLSLLLIPIIGIPVSATPIEDNQIMDNMVILVKNRLEFQDSKNFRSNVASNEDGATNKNAYNLYWEFEDYDLSVSVRDDGVITNYNYSPKEYKERTSLLFTVTKDEAKQIANDFIKKLNPKIYSEYELVDVRRNTYAFRYTNLTSRFGGDDYVVSYVRKVNGIPFKPNTITVNISGFDGYVSSCNTTYHENVIFDEHTNITTLENAKEIFKSNLNLEYSYKIKYDYEEKEDGSWESIPTTVLVYRDITDKKYIEATTGKLFEPHEKFFSYRNYGYGMGSSVNGVVTEDAMSPEAGEFKYTLTEEEKREISDTKDVLQPNDVVDKIKALNLFNIPDNATVSSFRLFKNDDGTKEYSLTLKTSINSDTISITADANTAEVKRFRNNINDYYDYHNSSLTGYKSYAIDFTKNYFKNSDHITFDVEDKGLDFTFYRIENNIPCYDNYINVTVDKTNYKINYFAYNWTEVDFIDPANAISIEDAKNIFIKNFEYSLFYYLDNEIGEDIGDGKSRAILAWGYNNEYSDTINAHTKEFLDYDYKTLVLPTVRETIKVADKYTDIDGHWAKDIITIMQNNNVGVVSTEFKPNAVLTYADLFELLGNIVTEDQFDEFKDFIKSRELKGLNFINENTKLTDTLTREEYCALIVSIGNYNYDRIIDNGSYFKLDYTDAHLISQDKVGYIAIAKMLKYLSGNTFRPLDKITKAEAITYLYNIYTNIY